MVTLGTTADWVAITEDAVWVGSTNPNAVHRIDPGTGEVLARVDVPGQPGAGLTVGLGSLWVPLCTERPSLAKVDYKLGSLTAVYSSVGPAQPEGGITTGAGSVWLMIDALGTLARIDPEDGSITDTAQLPAGSYNPLFHDGLVWVTQADGAVVSVFDPLSMRVRATVATGPSPRFLAGAYGAVWTLNRGDGTLTRVDERRWQCTATVELDTPGLGGDIAVGGGLVWTTVRGVPLSAVDGTNGTLRCQWAGPGGDSVGVGHGAIWLVNCRAGQLARIDLVQAIHQSGIWR